MRSCYSAALFILLSIAALPLATAQERIRATLAVPANASTSDPEGRIRAKLGSSSANKIIPYSTGKNVLELELGAIGDPSGTNGETLEGLTREYKSITYQTASYIRKFSPYFGLGVGYEKINANFTDKLSVSDVYIFYDNAYKITSSVEIFKLLMRVAVLPEKSWTPELTIGLGRFTEQDKIAANYSGGYYWFPSWEYYNDTKQFRDRSYGFAGSVKLGVRYHLAKWFSLGAGAQLEYLKPSKKRESLLGLNNTALWRWYRYGAFAGWSF